MCAPLPLPQNSKLAVGLVLSWWVFFCTYARGNPDTAHAGTAASIVAAIVMLGQGGSQAAINSANVTRIEQNCIGVRPCPLVSMSAVLWVENLLRCMLNLARIPATDVCFPQIVVLVAVNYLLWPVRTSDRASRARFWNVELQRSSVVTS